MQDAVAACGEIIADASRRAEGAVGDEQYIYKLVDGQFADGVEVTRDFDDPRRKLYSFCCVPKKDCPGTWGFVYAANTVREALNNFFRDFAYFNDFELAHLAPSTNPLAINNINRN